MPPLQTFTLLAAFLLCQSVWAQSAFELHGYVQGRLTRQPSTPARMEIRRARLSASGNLVPRLSYKVQADFAKSPYLMDAFVTVRFWRPLSLTAGQTKIPFSAESLISDDKNAPVSRSRAVLALAPGRDTGLQARDVGALAAGTVGVNGRSVDYAAGVFRGQTFIYAPAVHYNAMAGRVMLHPLHGSTVGADWYGSFSAPAGFTKRRVDIEGELERGRATFRGEQILARDGNRERRGGYLLGVYRLNANMEAIARADWLTTDIHKADTNSIAYVAGGNVYLFKHVKIGLDAGAQHDPGPKGWSSLVTAQIMPFF